MLLQIEKGIATALEDIRRLVYNLRPPALDELGLPRALQQDAPRHLGLEIVFKLPPEVRELPAAVEVAVYRIVQEALTNVVRHSHATRAVVAVTIDQEIRITISDDGRGMPENYIPGVGLNSMRDRAEELGGSFWVTSQKETGTSIEVSLPIIGGDQ
jgi:signal transduction histidine kinase